MQMQCKAAMMLLLSCCCCKSSGIDYALLYPEKKRKKDIVRSARIHDNKMRNTNNNKKKNILLSKVARHQCKSAATCHMPCLTQLLPCSLHCDNFIGCNIKCLGVSERASTACRLLLLLSSI